jgi:hypothetical protein
MPTKKPTTKKNVVKATKAAVKKVTKKPVAKKVVKKAVKKTTAKKPVARKTTAKKVSKKTTKKAVKKTSIKKPVKDLVYAPDHESFWTTDGEILNSLVALSSAFSQMPDDVYEFHAGGAQNDFSLWVDGVLCDGECAAALVSAKTPKKAHTIVVRHLKLYTI